MTDIARQTPTKAAIEVRAGSDAAAAATFQKAAQAAKSKNAELRPDTIAAAVDEALEWARRG